MKQQARQDYKQHGAFSLSDNEPRLLVLDAFSAHKKKKDDGEQRAQEDFIVELKRLNTTVSMVPPGATG